MLLEVGEETKSNTLVVVVFVCCHPICSGRQTTPFGLCGRTSRGHQGENHTAVFVFIFYGENDLAVPFPRRP